MQTFDQHLLNLYRANTIKLATACEAASNPHDFANQLALEGDTFDTEETADSPRSIELEEERRF
ncbi:MAG: hypothetical protein O7B23_11750 [Deltaproteobacteria bacterium]|nr:hypothetical protein [Deltaproteobacteria bacterium]